MGQEQLLLNSVVKQILKNHLYKWNWETNYTVSQKSINDQSFGKDEKC